jgi:hypothetical protein
MRKTAGMFIELGPVRSAERQESILASVSPEPLADVDQVLAYLKAGHGLIAMMDLQDDVVDGSRQVMNGSSVRTDGDWLWREDLAYYVERHNVAIPTEFLDLVRRRRYRVPDLDEPTLEECTVQAEHLMF